MRKIAIRSSVAARCIALASVMFGCGGRQDAGVPSPDDRAAPEGAVGRVDTPEPATEAPEHRGAADIASARAACAAAAATKGWQAEQRRLATDARDLQKQLEGTWYYCEEASIGPVEAALEDRRQVGMQFGERGAYRPLYDGADGMMAGPEHAWKATSRLEFDVSSAHRWAVFSPDGAFAKIGALTFGSTEIMFVRMR